MPSLLGGVPAPVPQVFVTVGILKKPLLPPEALIAGEKQEINGNGPPIEVELKEDRRGQGDSGERTSGRKEAERRFPIVKETTFLPSRRPFSPFSFPLTFARCFSSQPFQFILLTQFLLGSMSGLYNHSRSFSPASAFSPQTRSSPDVDSQYLAELLTEHQKLGPFLQVLPICSRLLNQEIMRVSGVVPKGFGDYDRLQIGIPSPMASPKLISDMVDTSLSGWKGLQQEKWSFPQGMAMDWEGVQPNPSSYFVKKILRMEVPVDAYPNFNFVGRLLGPRGNSLKRVEATTGCRVYIRGKGSIKDPDKEEKLRGRPGYEHLSEPLHILVEAELPANIVDAKLRYAHEILEELLKPVDESHDHYKRQQLRELALLNSGFKEDSPLPSGSLSPFNTSKRPKTGV
ncbi:hypothetical protein HPP92_017359 [Vanilla planifolia]|uniref:K Homology domain-containing protein n=1 Tax=Vanilla planifolia TaxID=51239 RepID=A0A835QC33_VANPL|nr:hypothetical protein HPP92_017359 [Vanilla planifolia]